MLPQCRSEATRRFPRVDASGQPAIPHSNAEATTLGIADGPIVEVGECDPDQLRFCLKSLRNSAPQFQTDFIIDAMTHDSPDLFSPAPLITSGS